MQGKKLSIVFPTEVYNFIQDLSKKMQTVPAKAMDQTGTFQPVINPMTGEQVPMSQTGKVEEFIHMSIVQSMATIIMTDQKDMTFLPERMKLEAIMNSYGEFIRKSLGNATQKSK